MPGRAATPADAAASCSFGGWLEFVWVRFDESFEAVLPLVRQSPVTFYQVVDSGRAHPSYRTPAAVRNITCGACCRRRFVPNRGRETPAYLHYMAERYDTLPQWVAFVHGAPHGTRHTLHRVAACLWREAPPEWNAAETVPDYVPIVPTTYVAHRDIHYRDWEPGYAELWRRWRSSFRPASAALARDAIDDPTPHLPRQHTGVRNVSFECCAQFLASRRALRRNPRQVYEVGLEVALTFDGANPNKASELDKASNFGLNWAARRSSTYGMSSSGNRCTSRSTATRAPVRTVGNAAWATRMRATDRSAAAQRRQGVVRRTTRRQNARARVTLGATEPLRRGTDDSMQQHARMTTWDP